MCRKLPARILVALLLIIPAITSAQKVSQVLDVGPDEIIQGRAKLLLKFNSKSLDYDMWDDEKTRFRPLKDSTLFLAKQSSVSVYSRPLNPLNYSFQSSVKFVPSAISQEAETALQTIAGSLVDLQQQIKKDKTEVNTKIQIENAKIAAKNAQRKTKQPAIPEVTCAKFETMVSLANAIQRLLKKDQKSKVKEIFTQLKAMSFEKEAQTKTELEAIFPEIEKLETDLGDISSQITTLEQAVAEYDCDLPNTHPYIAKFVFNSQIALMKTALKERQARYDNLKKCFDLVKKAYNDASSSDEGLKWMVAFQVNDDGNNIEVKKKTVSDFLVTVNEDGYKLSGNDEITAAEKKVKIKVLVRMLKFQRFLPEVIPGAAYAFLKFPKFGVVTDASGNQVVADAGEDNFKRINFSAMVNFNYFVPQSSVHPFLQIGVGANTDYPTFFTGIGFRFDVGGSTVKAISISGGLASTWVKTLKTLKIGDVVKGMADVEKDITHEFNWPPKGYIGLQLRF